MKQCIVWKCTYFCFSSESFWRGLGMYTISYG